MIKRCLKLVTLCCMITLIFIGPQKIVAENKAYIVSASASYVNPETGLSTGTNSEDNNRIGENMTNNVSYPEALVEEVDGKIYVTIALGMSDQIGGISIQTQASAGGGFGSVATTYSGQHYANGQTYTHYRFEVIQLGLLVNPHFVVTGMGKDVSFFMRIGNDARAGSGVFTSHLTNQAQNQTGQNQTNNANNTTNNSNANNETDIDPNSDEAIELAKIEEQLQSPVDVDANPLLKAKGLSSYIFMKTKEVNTSQATPIGYVIAAIGGGVIILGGGFILWKKRGSKS